jgi:hypothetical protein
MSQSHLNSEKTRAIAAERTLSQSSAEAMPYLETAIPIGMAGAAAVAVLVFLLDLVSGQPLATPNALGATIFRGMPFDLATPIETINVFSYTLLHSALFIVAATAAITAEFSLSTQKVSLKTQFLIGVVALWSALQASITTLMLLLDIPVVDGFAAGRLLTINALAATAMATVVYILASKRLEEEDH